MPAESRIRLWGRTRPSRPEWRSQDARTVARGTPGFAEAALPQPKGLRTACANPGGSGELGGPPRKSKASPFPARPSKSGCVTKTSPAFRWRLSAAHQGRHPSSRHRPRIPRQPVPSPLEGHEGYVRRAGGRLARSRRRFAVWRLLPSPSVLATTREDPGPLDIARRKAFGKASALAHDPLSSS